MMSYSGFKLSKSLQVFTWALNLILSRSESKSKIDQSIHLHVCQEHPGWMFEAFP